jgi:Skp family chaperone for outer membrane proteins
MLSKCLKCDFNVRNSDEFCLNCGLKDPAKDTFRLGLFSQKRLLFSSIFIFFLISSLVVNALTPAFDGFTAFRILFVSLWSVVVGSFLGLAFNYIVVAELNSQYLVNRFLYNKNNLIDRNKTISKRMTELQSRLAKLENVINRIGIAKTQNLQSVQQKLVSARKILSNHFLRYKLQQQRIELIRSQNKISPYVENVERLNEFETENGIVTAGHTIEKVTSIEQELARDFPAQIEAEKQHFIEQLKQTENVCEKLREVLLSKQAMRALKDISPLDDLNLLPQTVDLSHASETFSIQATLTDFSDSFEQLESEYRRIIDESEVSQKLIDF